MLAFRIKSEVLSLTLRSSLDLVPDHLPSSSHKPLSLSTPGFNLQTPVCHMLGCGVLWAVTWREDNGWGTISEAWHKTACIWGNVKNTQISDAAGMKMGMRIARLIESHVFTEAQRIPFRNRNWPRICQWTRQNGCMLETKSTKICWAEPQIPMLIIKKLTCTGNADAARRLIRERY